MIVPEIGNIFWADFGCFDHCLSVGKEAVEAGLSVIRRQMLLRRIRTLGGAIHPGRSGQWRHSFLIL